jgi:beta-fructofuranosidase
MLIHPGNHLGDSWYYVEGDTIHCFYLTCPESVERHTAWDIGHATSGNLVDWTIQPLVLRKGEPGSYDGRCPATGSVIRFNGRYWLAYTGNWSGPYPTVALAVSDDLYLWQKLAGNPVTGIDPTYYDANPAPPPRDWLHWRDPFLFEHDGQVYHYVCAKRNDLPVDERGTLGIARTSDMVHWEVLSPPDVAPIARELECPQVYAVDGRYYLIFSTAISLFSDAFRAQHFGDGERLTSYAMVGPTEFGPFRIYGNGEIMARDYAVQPYANQVVFWQGNTYLMGTVWNDEQDFITDPIPLVFSETSVKVAAERAYPQPRF